MKHLLVLCCILTLTTSVNGKRIHFTDSLNNWRYLAYNPGQIPPISYPNIANYMTDTVIHGLIYRYMVHGLFYIGAFVREDTVLKEVFAITEGDTTERLLYNYNLNVGDTFVRDSMHFPVWAIDSVSIGGEWYRVWQFGYNSLGDGFNVIEGIGCDIAPLAPLYFGTRPLIEFESFVSLTCFYDPDTPAVVPPDMGFFDNQGSCSFENVAPISVQKRVKVWPDPASSDIQVSSPVPMRDLYIRNMQGVLVAVYDVLFEEQIRLPISELKPGFYVLEVTDQNGCRTITKFVK